MKIIEDSKGSKRFEGDWCNLFEVLEVIKYRPVLFIGDRKISTLWNFIQGYQFSLTMNKWNENSFPNFGWFSTWIKGRIDSEYDLSAGWKRHILTNLNDDEDLAFEKFFHYLEEFKSSKPKCKFMTISESQKRFQNHSHGKKWIDIYDRTKTILIFRLPPSESYWCFYINKKDELLAEEFEASQEEIINRIKYNFQVSEDWNRLDEEQGLEKLRKLIKEHNNI